MIFENISIEKQFINGLLHNQDIFPIIINRLKENDFFDKDCGLAYKLMREDYCTKRKIDLSKLLSVMEAPSYYWLFYDYAVNEQYNYISKNELLVMTNQILEMSSNRQIRENINILNRKDSFEAISRHVLIQWLDKQMMILNKNCHLPEITSINQLFSPNFKDTTNYHTGYQNFDNMSGGIHNGELWVICGDRCIGKTAFIIPPIFEFVKKGFETLFISAGLSESEMAIRLLSFLTGINIKSCSSLYKHHPLSQDMEKVIKEMQNIPLHFFFDKGLTVNKVRDYLKQEPVKILAIDGTEYLRANKLRWKGRSYLDEIEDPLEVELTDRQNILWEETFFALKNIAKDYNIPVIVTCMINTVKQDHEFDKECKLISRMPPGLIEYSDLAAVINRLGYFSKDDPEYTLLEVIHNKNGSSGDINLSFNKESWIYQESIY